MKIRALVAAAAVALLAVQVPASVIFTSAISHIFGTRAATHIVVAGAYPFAVVDGYLPSGEGLNGGQMKAFCSTGVPWQLADGTRGFLTAGHCQPSNDHTGTQFIKTRAGLFFGTWSVAGAPLGIRRDGMTTFSAGEGTMSDKVGDIAFVESLLPVGNNISTGGPKSRSLTPITSWSSEATPGGRLCFSGAFTGSRCGLEQGKRTAYKDGKDNIIGLAEAYYPPGDPAQHCAQPGDSGGVVYEISPDGRSASVVGIISGGSVRYYPGTKKVDWSDGCTVLYTPLGAAQSQFGGSPIIR